MPKSAVSIRSQRLGHLPVIVLDQGERKLEFTRLANLKGATGVLECSTDLGIDHPWSPAVPGIDYEITSETPVAGGVRVVIRILSADPRKFWRYAVN